MSLNLFVGHGFYLITTYPINLSSFGPDLSLKKKSYVFKGQLWDPHERRYTYKQYICVYVEIWNEELFGQ